jgi:hypothetical protein
VKNRVRHCAGSEKPRQTYKTNISHHNKVGNTAHIRLRITWADRHNQVGNSAHQLVRFTRFTKSTSAYVHDSWSSCRKHCRCMPKCACVRRRGVCIRGCTLCVLFKREAAVHDVSFVTWQSVCKQALRFLGEPVVLAHTRSQHSMQTKHCHYSTHKQTPLACTSEAKGYHCLSL